MRTWPRWQSNAKRSLSASIETSNGSAAFADSNRPRDLDVCAFLQDRD
jgi:hypothetical protein